MTGTLRYSDIVPTCTANELLDTLMAKFGAVLFVNSSSRTASIRLVRDILIEDAQEDLTKYRNSGFKNYFERGRQLRLSSKKTIESKELLVSAKTYRDTFEEFTTAYTNEFNIVQNSADLLGQSHINTIIAYARATRSFYSWNLKKDNTQSLSILSSGFFDWDRKLQEFDYLELSGVDEQVPMMDSEAILMRPPQYQRQRWFTLDIPAFLTGIRNNNSLLTVQQETVTDDERTGNPLAFCWAHAGVVATFGSPFAEIPINDNTTSNIAIDLCYYGSRGLFNNFMKEYDQ